MRTKITCSAIFSFSLLVTYDCFSQRSIVPKWEAGLNVGAYMYQGDLTPRRIGSIETITPGFGIFGTRIINRSFSARLMFNMSRLVANEAIYEYPLWRKERAFSSSTSVKELGVSVHWNIFGTNYEEVKFEPYVFAGGGLSYINVTRNYSQTNFPYFGETSQVATGLVADLATPTPKLIPVAPVGAGVRYHISNRIVLNLEGSYRLMRTDYFDGFSKAANPGFKDHYSSLSIGAAYKFGSKEKYGCPAVN